MYYVSTSFRRAALLRLHSHTSESNGVTSPWATIVPGTRSLGYA